MLNEKKKDPWCSVLTSSLFPQITVYIFMPLESAQLGVVCITSRTLGRQEIMHSVVTSARVKSCSLCRRRKRD